MTTVSRRYRVRAPMEFEIEERVLSSDPALDYRVRVDTCGLCRSDLHFAQSWARDWEDLGHEFGGTIVAKRKEGGRFAIGDRVAVRNAAACGGCPACRANAPRACSALIVNKHGFSDYAECDERSLVDAHGLDDDQLALVEPVNVALDLIHSAGVESNPDLRVAVLGSGTLGLITAFLLDRRFGLTDVVVLARQATVPQAADLGIRYTTFDDAAAPGGFEKALGGRPGVVLVTSPPVTLPRAIDLVAPGGRILTVGLDRDEGLTASIDVRTLIFRRARLEGVFAVPNLYFEEAVTLLGTVGRPLAALITERTGLSDLPRVLGDWASRAHYGGKVRIGRLPSNEGARA